MSKPTKPIPVAPDFLLGEEVEVSRIEAVVPTQRPNPMDVVQHKTVWVKGHIVSVDHKAIGVKFADGVWRTYPVAEVRKIKKP